MRLTVLALALALLDPCAAVAAQHATTPAKVTTAATVRPVLVAQLGNGEITDTARFSNDQRYVVTTGGTVACIWDVTTGRQLRQIVSDTANLVGAVYSPDGRFILTGGLQVCMWQAATGRLVRKFPTGSNEVSFSPDGRCILTCDKDPTARIWDVETAKEVMRFRGHSGMIQSARFSLDNRYVLTGSGDTTARLWDRITGREIRRFTGHSMSVQGVAISPNGRFVATSSSDGTSRLWDSATGRQTWLFRDCSWAFDINFSPDGRYLLLPGNGDRTRLYEVATGRLVRRYGQTESITSLCFSPDGRLALTATLTGRTHMWDVASGRELQSFEARCSTVRVVACSPEGASIAVVTDPSRIAIWNAQTGMQQRLMRLLGYFPRHGALVANGRVAMVAGGYVELWDTTSGTMLHTYKVGDPAAISSDGRYVLARISDKKNPDTKDALHSYVDDIALVNVSDGTIPHRWELNALSIDSAAISPDGLRGLVCYEDKTGHNLALLDLGTGKTLKTVNNVGIAEALAFSKDGARAIVGIGHVGYLLDVAGWKVIGTLQGHSEGITSAAFTVDGRTAITASWDKTVRLWDVATGRQVRALRGHQAGVMSIAVSQDGRHLWTGGYDCTTRLWDISTGKELCSLMTFTDGNWAVMDPEGRYDASDPDNSTGLCWVANDEPIDLWQLKARYYEPGLLAKALGLSDKPLRSVKAFTDVKFYPAVRLIRPAAGQTALTVELTNRNGGIGPVQVWVNGKELLADARGPKPNPTAPRARLTVDLANAPGLRPGETNVIRVTARNAEGYLQSRGVEDVWTAPGRAQASYKPQLYAIIAGIDDYASANLHLRLPAHDASQIAHAVELGAKRLFGVDRVHVALLASGGDAAGAAPPTKQNLQAAFEAVRKRVHPEDILLVYLAGHGVAVQDSYYYLTAEARSVDLSDPAIRRASTLSDTELAGWTNRVRALKQVLILDTCAAGSAARRLAEKRDISGDQIRAVDRLKDRTGFYVLMGCASDAVSYESSQYGQGLLTYALLAGMQGEKLRDGQFVDVASLFEFAADRVPALAAGIGGIQRPQVLTPATNSASSRLQQASFDIGQMTIDDRRAVILPESRPRVLRPTLLNRDSAKDDLALTAAVRQCLREQADESAARGHAPIYLDVDPEDVPNAIVVSGLYSVTGDTVNVDLVISKNGKDSHVPVAGAKADIRGIATRITALLR